MGLIRCSVVQVFRSSPTQLLTLLAEILWWEKQKDWTLSWVQCEAVKTCPCAMCWSWVAGSSFQRGSSVFVLCVSVACSMAPKRRQKRKAAEVATPGLMRGKRTPGQRMKIHGGLLLRMTLAFQLLIAACWRRRRRTHGEAIQPAILAASHTSIWMLLLGLLRIWHQWPRRPASMTPMEHAQSEYVKSSHLTASARSVPVPDAKPAKFHIHQFAVSWRSGSSCQFLTEAICCVAPTTKTMMWLPEILMQWRTQWSGTCVALQFAFKGFVKFWVAVKEQSGGWSVGSQIWDCQSLALGANHGQQCRLPNVTIFSGHSMHQLQSQCQRRPRCTPKKGLQAFMEEFRCPGVQVFKRRTWPALMHGNIGLTTGSACLQQMFKQQKKLTVAPWACL